MGHHGERHFFFSDKQRDTKGNNQSYLFDLHFEFVSTQLDCKWSHHVGRRIIC
jgi:hypothetical protein